MGERWPVERELRIARAGIGDERLVQSFITPARGMLVLKGRWTRGLNSLFGLKAGLRGGDGERFDGLCA